MSDGPINYTSQFAPPVPPNVAFAQGLALADRANQQIAVNQQQQAAMSRQDQISKLLERVNGPQGTANDRAQLTMMLNPDQAKVLQDHFSSMDKQKLSAAVRDSMAMFVAFDQGETKLGIDLMKQQAEARRASGDEPGAKMLETWVQVAEVNPNATKNWLGGIIPLSSEGKDAMQSYLDQRKSPHDINLVDAQAAQAWANSEKDRLAATRGVPLSASSEGIVNRAIEDQADQLSKAAQYSDIASAIERVSPAGGLAGRTWEEAKKLFGGQDIVTTLKQEWLRLKNPEVLKSLPPGAASDLDIKTAQAAFPDENANPAQIASFARGIAKLKTYEASINGLKAGWISENGNLGTAKSEFSLTIPGQTDPVTIKSGETFKTVLDKLSVPKIASAQIGDTGKPATLTITLSDGTVVGPFPDQKTLESARADAIKSGLIKK